MRDLWNQECWLPENEIAMNSSWKFRWGLISSCTVDAYSTRYLVRKNDRCWASRGTSWMRWKRLSLSSDTITLSARVHNYWPLP